MSKHLIHKNSKELGLDDAVKLPIASDIEYGELAINYLKGNETLSLKNSEDEIITLEIGGDYVAKSGDTMSGNLNILTSLNVGIGNIIEIDGISGDHSFTQGINCSTVGAITGSALKVTGDYSHAEGSGSTAFGTASHAEGNKTYANGGASHAEGSETTAEGNSSHSEGFNTYASALYSHAEGNKTHSSGQSSHAEGFNTLSYGINSHAEGQDCRSFGLASHAEGVNTVANNTGEHSNGAYNVSISGASQNLAVLTNDGHATLFSIGNGVTSFDDSERRNAFEVKWNGDAYFSGDTKFAKGITATTISSPSLNAKQDILVSGTSIKTINGNSIVGGGNLVVITDTSDKLAKSGDTMSGNLIINKGSINVGNTNIVTGKYAMVQGNGCSATTDNSHAEGNRTRAVEFSSHAEGGSTIASGYCSHAEGGNSKTTWDYAHAEGFATTASGEGSHAEGGYSSAKGDYSHSEGFRTIANGLYSHAEGWNVDANNRAEHANGIYNVSISGANQNLSALTADTQATLFSIGNGYSDVDGNIFRQNAFEIKYNGDTYFSGDTKFAKDIAVNSITVNTINSPSINGKQEELISGTNIKTINGASLLGSGNISVGSGGGGSADSVAKSGDTMSGSLNIDSTLNVGLNNIVTGTYALAQGKGCHAIGDSSHAEGNTTIANGVFSHAEGEGTSTNNTAEHAIGTYNKSTIGVSQDISALTADAQATLFSVGNGEWNNKKNAFEIKYNGDAYFSGDTKFAKDISVNAITVNTINSPIIDTLVTSVESVKTLAKSIDTVAKSVDTVAKTVDTVSETVDTKQNTLVSGVNIKSINNISLVGAGDIIVTADTSNRVSKGGDTMTGALKIISTLNIGPKTGSYESNANIVTGGFAFAQGSNCTASGSYSHAEGNYTKAIGIYSHAEGIHTATFNNGEHASGYYNQSFLGENQHVSALTKDSRATLFSIGNGVDNENRKNAFEVKWNGDTYINCDTYVSGDTHVNKDLYVDGGISAHTISASTIVGTIYATTDMANKLATPRNIIFDGDVVGSTLFDGSSDITINTVVNNQISKTGDTMTGALNIKSTLNIGGANIVTGQYSHAQGSNCTASGDYSTAKGVGTKASGGHSHAEGRGTTASGEGSHAEGRGTTASGDASHAEGERTIASGEGSHAEGDRCTASGSESHAEGFITVANGYVSHAEGYETTASGWGSHAEGSSTIANNRGEHASGAYNVSISGANQDLTALTNDSQATLFSIGNGYNYYIGSTHMSKEQNAFEVKWNGDTYISGDTKFAKSISANIITSPTIDVINTKLNALSTEWFGTQAEYDLIPTKDNNTLYYIYE